MRGWERGRETAEERRGTQRIVIIGDRRAPANAVLKRVTVPSAELAVCGSDGSVTASPRGGVESNRSKTARP